MPATATAPRPMDQAVRSDTIRYWMMVRGYNQSTLAAAVGVAQPTVYNWLDAVAPRLYFATGLALARVLRITPEQLLQPPPASVEDK